MRRTVYLPTITYHKNQVFMLGKTYTVRPMDPE